MTDQTAAPAPPAAVATVDLSAIAHNLAEVRRCAPGAAVMVALKANAYGHGAIRVAEFLQSSANADALGVALVAEGMALRAAGIGLPILKFSTCLPDELESALQANLWLTVADEDTVRQAAQAASRLGVEAIVHLKLDTGMGRIGAPAEQAMRLVELIDREPALRLEGIFTHLPVVDGSGSGYTEQQLDRFLAAVAQVSQARGPVRWVHASNSAGILAHHRPELTCVRPGIMAWGYSPDPAVLATPGLRPALSWTTRLTFMKYVTAGTTIGYSRSWTAAEDCWIGTIAVGYGDGFSRAQGASDRGAGDQGAGDQGAGGEVLVAGTSVPVVGRICMDQTMINFGSQRPAVRVGDPVTLIGRMGELVRTADDLAAVAGTISYEVLCGIAARVPRRYQG